MTYEPTEWEDRVVTDPQRYLLEIIEEDYENGDDLVRLIERHGNILEEGTPINANNLNNIENGIQQKLDKEVGERFKISYNDIDDALEIEVI